jgi:peptidoglycan L-alanyl-D-glutamate endopeptidase CwlK
MDLQILCDTVLHYVDCSIIKGHRGKEEQNDAFHRGDSKLKWPLSKHNHIPSLAVDLSIYPIDMANTARNYWFGGFVLGVAKILHNIGLMHYDIRWGGDWDRDNDFSDQTLNDLCHFELIKK